MSKASKKRRRRERRWTAGPGIVLDLEAGWSNRSQKELAELADLVKQQLPKVEHPAFPGTRVPEPVDHWFGMPQQYTSTRRTP